MIEQDPDYKEAFDNELIERPSWWKRNWKWVVPVGGCLTLTILFFMMVGGLIFGITSAMEESQPYEYALEKINQDKKMIELLGSPIEKDGMVQGNFNWTNGKKGADMRIPIAGPKGAAILYVKARGEGDEWVYDEIRVEMNEGQSSDLLIE